MLTFRLDRSDALLDIVSYGRRGSQQGPLRLAPAQVEQIRRTVTRTPEVMVKVTGGGGASSSAGVKAHFRYIGRQVSWRSKPTTASGCGERESVSSCSTIGDLDMDQDRKRPDLFTKDRRRAPKLVHRLIFSMPAGTPPDKVLSAARDFAREQFGLKHRYAMVLHTDEPHPHVHVVVKAMSEEGERLNIRKGTLQDWRQRFAQHLREHGVEANATARAIRGRPHAHKKDGIYRASLRGASTHMRRRAEEAVRYLAERRLPTEPGKAKLIETRRNVEQGWRAVVQALEGQGERHIAESVSRFVAAMPPVRTDRELMIEQLLEQTKTRGRNLELTR